ncbi:alpha/beta-hydrolase [Lentinus tigrinus ALCF2SS1-7]|uniref:alpha/beta-hydrolase n=1 Tax=Lentinus tigrinus ALCF2SS1-7 TaxID=1328758 RepID=UPI0011660653|nr:alpha/beta-hydrolase [Lentinus tigrinus ALCF2SS1-7]
MASSALTYPPPGPYDLPTCHPKPLKPSQTPPRDIQAPQLPTPPRKSLLDEWYTLSTHLVPAACPRTTPFVPLPPLPQWSPNKDEFQASVQRVVDEVSATKEAQWLGKLDHLEPNSRQMWICVNRYVRKGLREDDTGKGVTLFMSHANGFPKEIWEPLLRQLTLEQEHANYKVDEIWSWEAANHGDSCLINADALGGLYDWRDNSRDILQFLQYYLPTTATPDGLPTALPRLADDEAESRRVHGLTSRRMVYVGHSFGGCTVLRAAMEQPQLFKYLYMLDAMIQPIQEQAPKPSESIKNLVAGAVRRRDGWSSKEEAHKGFSAIPFFKAWDPSTLDVYIECALYRAPDGQLKLKMPGIQEAVCFAESYATFEMFELLEKLPPAVETRWLMARDLPPQDTEKRRKVAWRRKVNTTHRIVPSGHLIAQEIPSVTAKDLHEFLSTRYGTQKALL